MRDEQHKSQTETKHVYYKLLFPPHPAPVSLLCVNHDVRLAPEGSSGRDLNINRKILKRKSILFLHLFVLYRFNILIVFLSPFSILLFLPKHVVLLGPHLVACLVHLIKQDVQPAVPDPLS